MFSFRETGERSIYRLLLYRIRYNIHYYVNNTVLIKVPVPGRCSCSSTPVLQFSIDTTEYSIMTHHTASRLDPGFPRLVSRHKDRPPEYFFVQLRSGCKLKLSKIGALAAGSPPLLTLLVSLPFLQPELRTLSPEGRPLIRVPVIDAYPTDSRVPLLTNRSRGPYTLSTANLESDW